MEYHALGSQTFWVLVKFHCSRLNNYRVYWQKNTTHLSVTALHQHLFCCCPLLFCFSYWGVVSRNHQRWSWGWELLITSVTGNEQGDRHSCVIFLKLCVCVLMSKVKVILTLSMRTTFSDRVSLNAFQNGGKPSLWYNFCLDIMISLLLFGIWQPVIIVSICLKNAEIYLSFSKTVSYLKYLALNENDDLSKVISWAT